MKKRFKYYKKMRHTLDDLNFSKAMMDEGKRLQEKVYSMGPQAVKEVGEALYEMIKTTDYDKIRKRKLGK
jgi:hypothetical protein